MGIKNFWKFVENVGLFSAILFIVWDWFEGAEFHIDDEGVLRSRMYVDVS